MNRCATWSLAALMALAAGCSPISGGGVKKRRKSSIDYKPIPGQVSRMLPRIRAHVKAVAEFGPRQTGQDGWRKTRDYIRRQLEEIAPQLQIETFSSPVTVALDRTGPDDLNVAADPFTHVVVEGLGAGEQTWPAYAFQPNGVQPCRTHPLGQCPLRRDRPDADPCPNCERPRRLVDIGAGTWDDLAGKDLSDTVVLLDFNSGDAWLRAASLGAAGAIFIEPLRTTVFQADRKYLATVPMHFPRVYLKRDRGLRLRRAAAEAAAKLRVTIKTRMRFENVPGDCFRLTVPGKDRSYCFVLAVHYDARGIVPDLAYGAAELWGIAELLELTRHLVEVPPNCDVQIFFTSGHWQMQRPMRDYIRSIDPSGKFGMVGDYYRMAFSLDMVPQGRSLNLMIENPWDAAGREVYQSIGRRILGKGDWRHQLMDGLGLEGKGVEMFAGLRPLLAGTKDGTMALRDDRSPQIFAPKYPTAEGPWQTLRMPTLGFQTSRLARLVHNTPLDRLAEDPTAEARAAQIDHQLTPQLQMMMAVLDHLLAYPVGMMAPVRSGRHTLRNYGGYAQIRGHVQMWDRSIGWFSEILPSEQARRRLSKARKELTKAREELDKPDADRAKAEAAVKSAAALISGLEDEKDIQTFIYAFPTDRGSTGRLGGRPKGQLPWPTLPSRGQHRELQAFMFAELRLLEDHNYQINTIYAQGPTTQYNIVAYAIDRAGRIRYATDFGVNGDGNKSFQCTDLNLETWDLTAPITIFECGALELFDLVDPQRYNPSSWVYPGYLVTWSGQTAIAPFLKITGVKDVDSHTDVDRWGFVQFGSTGMVFLPARHIGGIEILLGTLFTNFALLNNPDADGVPRGYRLRAGESRRLATGSIPGPLACVRQLAHLDKQRLEEFRTYDVVSPLAEKNHAATEAIMASGERAQAEGNWRKALADYMRAWIYESKTYRNTLGLLMDVVSTTVLYFILLIPFSFLVERLVFPQRTVLRTAIVAVTVFAVFAGVLYVFHPGFKLAHNVVVTVTAFVIVVMTIPALILLLVRGVAMLRAIGSKSVITQQSEAESAGVVIAALSLAVSNMRRRRLRTALTLVTITTMVVALVLLTTSSAFDFKIQEPPGQGRGSVEGIQVFNARDLRLPLLTEAAEVYESALGGEALVIRRECVDYGFAEKLPRNGALLLRAGAKEINLPYLQVMDYRDDLLEYTIREGTPELTNAVEETLVKGRLQTAKVRRLHLSDLMEGEFLAPGDVDVCLLPDAIAEKLEVKVGETVTLMGLPLKVKGIWQTQELRRAADGKMVKVPGPMDQLKDMHGFQITALHGAKHRQGEPESPIHAPSEMQMIVPRKWIREYDIFQSNVFSLIVIPKDADGKGDVTLIPALADKLATEILNVDVYSHYVDPATRRVNVSQISMVSATHVKGSSLMFVIMGVSVLMILAIMTGTVYERMREIHIFSSVGLSPRHVAGMFLIEALVYAGIASVLGYFIGIVSLKALLAYLKSTGQHQDFYPNYLGVFVLYSIGVAVLATVASSLYPIRLASKIVSPAAGTDWQADATGDDDRWDIRLPFIATTWDEARAMMVYACDFLAMHQGERSGRFVCESPPAGSSAGSTIHLRMPIWLAPFERNVSQDAWLSVAPVPDSPWWAMSLELRRNSGPPYLWRRGATVFVNRLTKHLLRWRAATAAQEADCLSRAAAIFGTEQRPGATG